MRRSAALKSLTSIWSNLKSDLENCRIKVLRIVNQSQKVRSDKQVDHFRPKNRVGEKDCEKHPVIGGLLLIGKTFVTVVHTAIKKDDGSHDSQTVGGKGDRFPLLDESKDAILQPALFR